MSLEYLKQHLAEQIANRRKRLGLSQKELAEKAKIGESTLGLIEQAKGNPAIETLDHIARALGTDILELCPPKKGVITIDLNALEALRNK